jgi:hypothetical protein
MGVVELAGFFETTPDHRRHQHGNGLLRTRISNKQGQVGRKFLGCRMAAFFFRLVVVPELDEHVVAGFELIEEGLPSPFL